MLAPRSKCPTSVPPECDQQTFFAIIRHVGRNCYGLICTLRPIDRAINRVEEISGAQILGIVDRRLEGMVRLWSVSAHKESL